MLGLRGLRVEENARVILQNLAQLEGDFRRFRDDFDLLGKHLSNAKTKHEDTGRRLDRLEAKLGAVTGAGAALPEAAAAEIAVLK